MEMTGFKEGDSGKIISSIHRGKLDSPKVKVFGQILSLDEASTGEERG